MKVTIVRSQTVKSANIARVGQDDLWVIYTTDDGHTGSVTLPAEDADEQHISAAITDDVRKHGSLKGKTFEV